MAAALVAPAAFATACGGDGSDPMGKKPPTNDNSAPGANAGTGAGSDKPKGGKADFDTVFNTEDRIRRALPDPGAMKGWKPETSGLAAWPAKRPGFEIVCGDRAPFFGEGATRGAAQAFRVADRWHLWHNLGEAAEVRLPIPR